MKKYKAPEDYKNNNSLITVFLAGSIEMGQAENWQAVVEEEFSNYKDNVLTILNPRRDDFNPEEDQSPENEYFSEQVLWELNGMEAAHYIFMYFHPDTKAPITLMELGLHVDTGKLIVVCPDGFWRKDNVQIVCEAYDVPVYDTLIEGMKELRNALNYDQNLFLR